MAFRFALCRRGSAVAGRELAAPKEVDEARRLSQSARRDHTRRVASSLAIKNATYAARYRALVRR